MKLCIGSDHAGFEVKEALKEALIGEGHEVSDVGPGSTASCDYPDFAGPVAGAVSGGEVERGILVCGTGIGMSIAANKFKGVRAALCHSEETAQMSRAHNDANVLCLGARVLELKTLLHILKAWMNTAFEGGRHADRLGKIEKFEKS